MKRVLVIDNYDSFTYNLVHYVEKLTDVSPAVFRNDEISLDEIRGYDKILLSPGPGIPVQSGVCLDLIRRYAAEKSILGVCLGHQAIGQAFGGKLFNLRHVYHGIATAINIIDQKDPLFIGLPSTIRAGRYHSWALTKDELPECLSITCVDDDGMIMGVSHKKFDVRGVQFHPESVLTEHGFEIIRNWINI